MSEEKWDLIIKPKSGWVDLRFKELWKYRDLLFLFVKRDFVAVYKQTILGPLWFIIQPILTTIMLTVIFGVFGGLSTDGLEEAKPLFYLAGLTLWNYFAECLTKTSETFVKNQSIFGKVFFPRLIVPLSIVVSTMLKFGIQFVLFIAVWCYYYFIAEVSIIHPSLTILLVPFMVIMMAGLSLGFGIIFSSITTKYKDMNFLLIFGVQLLMYASAVVIPLSAIPPLYQWIFRLNPMVNLIEAFKFSFLGVGDFSWFWLAYSFLFMCVLLFFGTIIFNKVEKSFMDTV
ncbi:MAG: ABC transporter permease [Crocinitomix sp.]|nr:ABC transporter permease [Crocinitomix sp.]